MGKGQGAPDSWGVRRPGRILFEMEGVTADEARKAMRLASAKLRHSDAVPRRDLPRLVS